MVFEMRIIFRIFVTKFDYKIKIYIFERNYFYTILAKVITIPIFIGIGKLLKILYNSRIRVGIMSNGASNGFPRSQCSERETRCAINLNVYGISKSIGQTPCRLSLHK